MSGKNCKNPSESNCAVNQREFDRMKTHFKVSVSVDEPTHGHTLITPADVQNISRGGLLIETSRNLSPGQTVAVSIPTEVCPDRMELPRALNGHAEVVHSRHGTNHRSKVGLRFCDNLRQLPEFVAFLDYLRATSEPLLA